MQLDAHTPTPKNLYLGAAAVGCVSAALALAVSGVLSDRQALDGAAVNLFAMAGVVAMLAALVWRLWPRPSGERALERLVARRTAQLQQERDQAREAAQAQRRFWAQLSHEIRTPMNAVVGTADLLLQTRLSSEQRQHVDVMQRAGTSMVTILSAALDKAGLEAGQVALRPTRCELRECLDDIRALYAADALQKGLTLVCRIGADVPASVMIDTLRLRQVLCNLLSNAIKFSSAGTVTLSCELERPVSDGQTDYRLCFAVADQGVGIAPSDQDRLFKPFSQVGEPGGRRGGSGLGLAICKDLAALMGGSIGVSSERGRGSRFQFTTPAGAAETPAAGTQAPLDVEVPKWIEPSRPVERLRGRVLVVDDDENCRLVMRSMLHRLGYRSDAAADGQEAIAACQRKHYAAVLMDMQMPRVDGRAAIASIRAAEAAGKRAAIVALTGGSEASEGAAALAAGADHYICKPVRFAQLDNLFASLPSGKASKTKHRLPLRVVHGAATSVVFDADIVRDLRAVKGRGNRDLFSEVAGEFISHAPDSLAAIERAAGDERRDELRRQAHKLLGLCRLIGAQRMAAICAALQRSEDTDSPDALNTQLSRLRREFEAARHEYGRQLQAH